MFLFKRMEGNSQTEGKKQANKRWKAIESRFFLRFMAEQIRSGVRIDKAFKTPVILAAIEALKVNFDAVFTESNIANHMRTLKRKWALIKRLKDLSGIGWDDDKKMIVMGEEEYNVYIKAHTEAEPFLNKPIEDHDLLELVCGNDQATGRFAHNNLTESISVDDQDEREAEDIVNLDHTNDEFVNPDLDFTSDPVAPRETASTNSSQGNTSRSGKSQRKGKKRVSRDSCDDALLEVLGCIKETSLRQMNKQLSEACMKLIDAGYTEDEAADVYAYYGADEARTCNFLEASELFRRSLARRVLGRRGGTP